MSQENVHLPPSGEEPNHFIEPDTHSFVIKLWLDDKGEKTGKVIWRGHITHVATGKRTYFDNLFGIPSFVGPYLEEINVRLPVFWRVYQWLIR